ncbi:MAG TPA: hypothetical protein PKJ41_05835 [Bryobacteraceae bacterium]|nr:hypothetical protein [Bryobacteraceae bacterium]HPT28483.1 hypothetical protein [Bryobacteraceae bacterium]
MSQFDPHEFLHRTYYSLDFQILAGDLVDFLETAERGLDIRYHENRARIETSSSDVDVPGYREHLLENLEHRFKISLPLRVRYGALIGFTTAVEWAAVTLNSALKDPIEPPTKRTKDIVRILSRLDEKIGLGCEKVIGNFTVLTHVRNCIAHAAGLIQDYEFGEELEKEIVRLNGILVGRWHVLGKHICIQRGALNPYFKSIGEFVVDLNRNCHEQGLI